MSTAKQDPPIEVGPLAPREPIVSSTVWRCRRCASTFSVPSTTPVMFVREAVERGGMALLRVHECADHEAAGTVAYGVAELVGSCEAREGTA